MDTPLMPQTPPVLPPVHRALSPRELFLPIVIVLAGIIVAASVYVVRIRHHVENGTGMPEAMHPVSPSDHIIGNPSAPVVIVEYGDIDSSYSKSFELTMEQLMTEYVATNKVAWVFRHFPVTTLHRNATTNALAAECAASVTTPATFFHFMDAMQAVDSGDAGYDPSNYAPLLDQFAVPKDGFAKCMSEQTFEKKIHDDYDNALASGATGSPYILLVLPGEKPKPLQGAVPYKTMKSIIDDALAKISTK